MSSNYPRDVKLMSVAERLALLEQVWDSLQDAETVPLLTPEQEAELDRRVAEHQAHPEDAIPWEEVRKHLQDRLSR